MATATATVKVQLEDEGGYLVIRYADNQPDEYGDVSHLLMYVYPEGDCDCVHWPLSENNPETLDRLLVGALYDAREMGHMASDVRVAVLPDGTEVSF